MPNKRELKRLERNAYHGAGHVVTAHIVRRRGTQVSIIPDDVGDGRCRYTRYPKSFDPDVDTSARTRDFIERYVMTSLGGSLYLTDKDGGLPFDQDDKEKMEELSLKFWQGMSEADQEAMGHPDMGRLYMEEMLEAFRQGSKGPAYDARLYTQYWGFSLEDISFDNVYLWYGETDVNVPVSMGRAMANSISNCKARFYPNESHLSMIANHSDEIMEAMRS